MINVLFVLIYICLKKGFDHQVDEEMIDETYWVYIVLNIVPVVAIYISIFYALNLLQKWQY